MKTKVLDTNIILEHSLKNIIEKLDKGEVETKIVLTFKVVMELDTFKKGNEIKNFNARESLRILEEFRKKAHTKGTKLSEGIQVSDKCFLRVYVSQEDLKIDPDKVDNDIILTSYLLADDEDEDVEIITLDVHERIIADCFDIESNGFETDLEDTQLYTGITEIPITDIQLQEMNADFHNREFKTSRKLKTNQFVVMKDSADGTHYGKYNSKDKTIEALDINYQAWGIKPKKDENGEVVMEQAMLMEMLLDPSIQFVSAIGPSGTGKTLVTLACALQQTIEDHEYNKILIMRPLASIDRDLGALPGTKLEKLEPWMGSSFDNLELLLDIYCPKPLERTISPRERVYDLIEVGILELEALQYVRGRSIPNQFIIVDDAQNLTPHQAATIITRAGEGTKVVFLGDINNQQIDNSRLNSLNNGLTHVVDRFKGKSPIIGHVTLDKVVRSDLASLGVELL